MIRPSDARWTIEMFAPTNQGGHLLLHTWHRGDASKDIEVQVCRTRQQRGELGRVVVHDHERGESAEVIP